MPSFQVPIRRLGASLLVTTDQAGDLLMARDEGGRLNTHFAPAPPGWAWPFGANDWPSAPRCRA